MTVLATGAAALVVLYQPAPQGSYSVVQRAAVTTPRESDPLNAELVRCRALPANVDDTACRIAWEASRRRFFGDKPAIEAADAASFHVAVAQPDLDQIPLASTASTETAER